jgi:glycosyltransferase involved in cell wall biosynthesis
MHYSCQALARSGVRVHVATTNLIGTTGKVSDVPTDTDVIYESNYSVRYYKGSGIDHLSWDFMVNLSLEIRKSDIVHLQDIYSTHAIQTLVLARSLNRPIAISPRGIFSPWALSSRRTLIKKAWLNVLIRPLLFNYRCVVWHATSDEERNDIFKIFPTARVAIIPNGIDCVRFSEGKILGRAQYIARWFPEATVSREGARVIVCMGRLHRVKGFDIAIRAFALIAGEMPDSLLLISGGDEGEKEKLELLIKAFSLEGRIRLVGETRGVDTVEFLKGADLFYFPSHSENFGLACLEALAAGLPVIASNKTPWSKIQEFGAGYWIDNSPEAFAAASRLLLRNPGYHSLRANARVLASEYGIASVAQQLRRLYQELIHENRKKSGKR